MLDNVLIPELKRVLSEKLGAIDKVESIQRLAERFKEEVGGQIDELVAGRLQAIETKAAEDRIYKERLTQHYKNLCDDILFLQENISRTERETEEMRRELEATKVANAHKREKNQTNLNEIARLAAAIRTSQVRNL